MAEDEKSETPNDTEGNDSGVKPVVDTDTAETSKEIINPILTEAKTLAERIEAGTNRYDKLIKKHEALLAEIALGGRAAAGQNVEKKEETPKEYADRMMGK